MKREKEKHLLLKDTSANGIHGVILALVEQEMNYPFTAVFLDLFPYRQGNRTYNRFMEPDINDVPNTLDLPQKQPNAVIIVKLLTLSVKSDTCLLMRRKVCTYLMLQNKCMCKVTFKLMAYMSQFSPAAIAQFYGNRV